MRGVRNAGSERLRYRRIICDIGGKTRDIAAGFSWRAGTAGRRGAGVACGGGGGASTADGAGFILAGCSRFVTGTGLVPAGGSREGVVPEKASATLLSAAVGREAACCSSRHLEVADEGSHRLKAVRGGNGRQR